MRILRYIFPISMIVFLLSCVTPGGEGHPDWVNNPPMIEDKALFVVVQPSSDASLDEMGEALAKRLWEEMGIENTLRSRSPQFDELTQQFIAFLKGEQDFPQWQILEDEIYQVDDKKYRAMLLSYRLEDWVAYQDDLLPQLYEEPPVVQDLRLKAQVLAEQGHYGSAFLCYLEAARLGVSLNVRGSQSFFQQNYQRAKEVLSQVPSQGLEGPSELYSGEEDRWTFQYNFPLDVSQDDRILFRISYRHPMEKDREAQAMVWTDNTGLLLFQHPSLFDSGEYSLKLTIDEDHLAQRLGVSPTSSEVLELQAQLQEVMDYQVMMDLQRLPMGIYIEDRDVVGKIVTRGNSAEKLKGLLDSQRGEVHTLSPGILDSKEVSRLQLLRDIQLQLPQKTVLLILGDSQILNFDSAEGGRVLIHAAMNYEILDLRNYQVLAQGTIDKQLEADDGTAALSGVYTQLSRELAQRYQVLVEETR